MKSLVPLFKKRRHRLIGLMSGTSADGVDAALVDVETLPQPIAGQDLTWELSAFVTIPYPEAVRAEVLAVQEGGDRPLERLTRLHFALSHLYADAVDAVIGESGVPRPTVDAIACHGQTVCHFPRFPASDSDWGREGPGAESWHKVDSREEGWRSASTLQIGVPAVLAERTGFPVISDFRSRDIAVGGTGAPLVPLVDHLLFSHPERSRLCVNVGGIANLTALRSGGTPEDVLAFDTGPGNMVVDALMSHVSGGEKHVDEGGGLARKGNPAGALVEPLLDHPFFGQAPPKAAGRGEFGEDFTARFLELTMPGKLTSASLLATGVWFTARTVRLAYEKFIEAGFSVREMIVSGGGAHNVALLDQLVDQFPGVSVVTSDYYGLDVDAKEAVAFALLGHLSLLDRPGNVPAATGASQPVVLGSLTPGREAR